MPLNLAEQLLTDLIALPLTIIPARSFLPCALSIGVANQIPIYDSIYIALAASHQYPLITVDAQQSKIAALVGVTLKPITDFR